MKYPIVLLSLITFTLLPALRASADFTGPGKNAAYASAEGSSFPFSETTILAASIEKGKAGRVLDISSNIEVTNGASDPISMLVFVNGFPVAPTNHNFGAWAGACTTLGCSVGGNWWLDLDAAEAAHSGVFIGQPLVVTVDTYQNGPGGQSYTSTLAVKMIKK